MTNRERYNNTDQSRSQINSHEQPTAQSHIEHKIIDTFRYYNKEGYGPIIVAPMPFSRVALLSFIWAVGLSTAIIVGFICLSLFSDISIPVFNIQNINLQKPETYLVIASQLFWFILIFLGVKELAKPQLKLLVKFKEVLFQFNGDGIFKQY